MSASEIGLLVGALIIGLFVLKYAFVGAVGLFAWSAEQGFVGAAAYFACWIFLFPFMLAAVIITGAILCWTNK